MTRPLPDIPAQAGLVAGAVPIFIIAACLTMFGLAPITAMPVAGALGFGFACTGLAVIHFVTRGMSGRTVTLVALYIAALLPNPAPVAARLFAGDAALLADGHLDPGPVQVPGGADAGDPAADDDHIAALRKFVECVGHAVKSRSSDTESAE